VRLGVRAYGVEGERLEWLRRLYREWPFFRALVENLEMTLAKSSFEIATAISTSCRSAEPRRFWARLSERARRTVEPVLAIVEATRCSTATRRAAARALRNPYVDPMNAIQVELLRAHRAGDERALRPLLRSIAGIAAALRNTG
jgi:phosphoenolpyruvate carboxylase